jgi:hypothetical protein
MRTISVIIFAALLLLGLIACNVPHVELSKPKQIDPQTFYQSADIGKRHLLKSNSGAIIISDKDVIVLDSANNVVIHEKDPAGVTYKIIAELNQNWIEQDSIKQSRGQNDRIQTSLRSPSKIKNPCKGPTHVNKDTLYWQKGPVVTFTEHKRVHADTATMIIGTPYLTKTEGILTNQVLDGQEWRITKLIADADPVMVMGEDNSPVSPVPKYKAGDTLKTKNGETVQITCIESYDPFGHGYSRHCAGSWDETVKDWVYNTLTVTNGGEYLYGLRSEKELDNLTRLEGIHIIGTGERNK